MNLASIFFVALASVEPETLICQSAVTQIAHGVLAHVREWTEAFRSLPEENPNTLTLARHKKRCRRESIPCTLSFLLLLKTLPLVEYRGTVFSTATTGLC